MTTRYSAERTLARPEYWDGAEAAREPTDIWGLRRIRAIRSGLISGKALAEIAEYSEWRAGSAAA